jgi:hypothetical protein
LRSFSVDVISLVCATLSPPIFNLMISDGSEASKYQLANLLSREKTEKIEDNNFFIFPSHLISAFR